jgi:hypothetical protein
MREQWIGETFGCAIMGSKMPRETNLRKIAPAQSEPLPGEVFALQITTGKFLFGQVLLANPQREHAPTPSANLVYIFATQHDSANLDNVSLLATDLLIPPLWTNSLGWKRGYFKRVAILRRTDLSVLTQHCFKRHDGTYVDEVGEKLFKKVDPCGIWGLVSYRWIDDHVSDALGIPRAPSGQ